jgi:glycerophosphoryl diester phosphodiesterase
VTTPSTTRDFAYLDGPAPIAFAHRGGAATAPENTMAAFAQAIAAGYRYVETDIHATADGKVVVFHDATLDRVTGRRGRIAQLPWHALRSARVHGTEPIPLLEDVLGAWPDARFNIDIKAGGAVEPLAEVLRRTNAIRRVGITSFSDRRLRRIRGLLGPKLCTALGPREVLRLRNASWWGRPGAGVTPGVPCVQIPIRFGLTLADQRLVDYAHACGLAVHVWTIDEPRVMNRLLDLGVDGIMTDRIGALREVYEARGLWAA